MDATRRLIGSPLATAMLGSALVGGQYTAGRAARDALFLSHFEVSALPSMVIATALFSILLVLIVSRALRQVAPRLWVPAGFAATALLTLADWAVAVFAPRLAAPVLYLLVSGLGPVLTSGFWLIASERFDPHTAKKTFGKIAGAGTLGGMLAGVAAAGVASTVDIGAMLPLLAVLALACAWFTHRLAPLPVAARAAPSRPPPAGSPRSGVRVLAETPYLRNLAVLVLMGAVAETFVDQVFKTHVKAELGMGQSLGSFLSLYYAALSLTTFVIQTGASRYVLEKLGLAAAASTPALTFLVGGAAALLVPGLRSLMLTRAGEAVVRASVYRAGYEIFYTPMAPDDKRAVKSIIDVGADRAGDIIGATMTQQVLWIPQPAQTTVLLWLAMACAGVGLLVAHRLTRGYAESLERSLLDRALELDLSSVDDLTTRTTLLRTIARPGLTGTAGSTRSAATSPPSSPAGSTIEDPELDQIVALRSRDAARVLHVLRSDRPLAATAIAHVIPLLARNDVSDECIRALRSVAEERVGELVDALTDRNQPFAVRRRLARVFSVCVSQRAADGVLLGLEDLRFEVRYQCARSLLAIVEKNPAIHIDKAHILALVQKEVAVNKDVWEKRRLLDAAEERDEKSFLEGLVRERANQSLAHVFTLLALVLPMEPLRIAFRGLHTEDEGLRGTALEYLESVLPREIREGLWRFLEDRRAPATTRRPHDETLANLLRSNQSIRAKLEELHQRDRLDDGESA
jgi:hypothetical protein